MTNTRILAFLTILVLLGVTLYRVTRPSASGRWHTVWIAMLFSVIVSVLADMGGGLGAAVGIAVVLAIAVKTAAQAGGLTTPQQGIGGPTNVSHAAIPTPNGITVTPGPATTTPSLAA